MFQERFQTAELIKATGGELICKGRESFDRFSTDTRSLQKNDFFVAIVGENFDPHNFLSQAFERGAAGLLISKPLTGEQKKIFSKINVILVNDTLKATQDFAHYWRKKNKAKIIGITGSNGKTTTKLFLYQLLNKDYKTYASEKSFNNHLGVPLTLLNIAKDTDVCICEMGTNHPGEIKALVDIAEPDIAVVTTVGEGHIGFFGTKDRISKEKQEIYNNIHNDPLRVYNIDNTWTQEMYLNYKNPMRALTISANNNNADIFMKIKNENQSSIEIKMTVEGHIKGVMGTSKVNFFGFHNVYNLMAAAGLAVHCGMSPKKIWERIPFCKTDWGRNQVIQLKSNAQLIFDAYNANPDSMKALVENGNGIKTRGKKIIILGDMLELGDLTILRHEELGQLVGKGQYDVVWFLGQFSEYFERGIRSTNFNKKLIISDGYKEPLACEIASMLEPEDIILMKGSRGAKLELVVPFLRPVEWEPKK